MNLPNTVIKIMPSWIFMFQSHTVVSLKLIEILSESAEYFKNLKAT